MVSDGYTHWVILQVVGNALMSVAPVTSMTSVYVAPTAREAMAILSRGDVAAMPLVGGNLQELRGELMRYGVLA